MGVNELDRQLDRNAFISRLENEVTSNPELDILDRLAQFLNVSLEWLITGRGSWLPRLHAAALFAHHEGMPLGAVSVIVTELEQTATQDLPVAMWLERIRCKGTSALEAKVTALPLKPPDDSSYIEYVAVETTVNGRVALAIAVRGIARDRAAQLGIDTRREAQTNAALRALAQEATVELEWLTHGRGPMIRDEYIRTSVRPSTYAARVRFAREVLRGLSRSALASLSQVKESTIALVESGDLPKQQLKATHYKLMKWLRVGPEWLGSPARSSKRPTSGGASAPPAAREVG